MDGPIMQQYPLQSPIKDHKTPPLDPKPSPDLPDNTRSPVSSSNVPNGYSGPPILTLKSSLPATSTTSDPLHAPSVSADVAQDAEGSPDPEFAEGAAAVNTRPDDGAFIPTSSSQSPRPGKRKVREDEEDYINNPELYGLRRSGRARNNPTIDSTGAEDSESDIDTRPANKRRRAAPQPKETSPPPQVLSSSDSDSDDYGSKKAKAQQRSHRRKMLSGNNSSTASGAEVRFSTRRSRKIAKYNVDDDDDIFEEDDPGYYYEEIWEDTRSEIDVIMRHRPKEDACRPEDRKKDDYEYNIKWVGKAYYHATWEPYSELSGLKGAKKVKNYFDKNIVQEIYMENDEDVSLEDKEQWNLDREQTLDRWNDFVKIERVIDAAEGEEGTEYLVKWKSLGYDGCTWELEALLSELNQKEVDRYLDRTARIPVSDKKESNPHTRSPYRPFREQPSYIRNGELRDFQITGVNFLAHNWCRGDSVILADEMGLGKTVQTVSFLNWLRHDRGQQGPFLVVVPLSTMPAWAETFDNWTPDINYVTYVGNAPARATIRDKELFVDGNLRRTKFHVLLTTYDYITMKEAWTPELQQIKWQFLAVDEAHRLKNKESQLYEKLMDLGAPSRLLITGTPVQNNLGELSALMNFLMPGRVVGAENIDLGSEEASRQINELTQQISPYIIRRTKQKVENDLPPKTEKIIRVELSDIQLDYYKAILGRNYAALSAAGSTHKQSLINIVMELKKASNHPFMFPGIEEQILGGSDRKGDVLKNLITSSGKMMLLDQLLTKMKKDGHRVLIFSQMVKMLDILSDYLKARGHQYQRLDGTIAAGSRKLAMDHFNAQDSKDFCFLLSTRAGGLGINLMTADTVILFDSDWNPQADLQAMARAHRIGQKKPVTVYRFISRDTIEEEIIERARNKLMLEFITIQRGVTDKDTGNFKERMAEAKRITDQPNDPEEINRILKRRGQRMFEQTDNQRKLEALDIDSVLENAEEHKTEQPEGLAADGGEDFLKSFEYTDVKVDLEWDEIIPKEQLEAIRAEEKRKEDERARKLQAEQNAPRKRKAPVDDYDGSKSNQRAAKKRARERAAAEKVAKREQDDESSGLSDIDEKDIVDPNKPLEEKEVRSLLRAFTKFGYIDEVPEEFRKEAKLEDRNLDLLRSTLGEIIAIAESKNKEEQDRLDRLEKVHGKVITKKDKKAILFDYRDNQRINAGTLLERPENLKMVRNFIAKVKDVKNFRIPEATKPANYTSDWGAREDGMLVVGVARHGYGAWQDIAQDPELDLGSKFYLDEHQVARKEERLTAENEDVSKLRSPGAVHLVRRMEYLFTILRAKTSGGADVKAARALENHHRNTKKYAPGTNGDRGPPRSAYSASPAPSTLPKPRPAHHQRLLPAFVKERNHDQATDKDRASQSRVSPEVRHRERERSRQPSKPHSSAHREPDRGRSTPNGVHRTHQTDKPLTNGDRSLQDHHSHHPRHDTDFKRSRHRSRSPNMTRTYHDHQRKDHHREYRERSEPRHHEHDGHRSPHERKRSHDRDERHGHKDKHRSPEVKYRQDKKPESKSESKPERPVDSELEAFLAPVMDDAKQRIREYKKSKGQEQKERVRILEAVLSRVGDFLARKEPEKGQAFVDRTWAYFVGCQWPGKNTDWNAVKKQYDILRQRDEAARTSTAAPKVEAVM